MAKTIHTILYDDVLDGSRIVTMDNCVCQLYDIKRDYDAIIKDSRENLSKPALYVLLNRRKRKAYIGETDDFSQRIASHMLKKDFWGEALAFMGIVMNVHQTTCSNLPHPPFSSMYFQKLRFCIPRIVKPIRGIPDFLPL